MKDRQRSEKMKVQKGKSRKRKTHREQKSFLKSSVVDPDPKGSESLETGSASEWKLGFGSAFRIEVKRRIRIRSQVKIRIYEGPK